MFSGYQEREEYEDELYAEEDFDDDSGPDSDLEFQLYSQLHYCADEQEKRAENCEENHEENRPSSCHESQPGPKVQPLSAPLDDIIMIDSGPDIITVSDTTEEEEEESVCTRKVQRSKEKGLAPVLQPHRHEEEEVVVLNSDSESDESSDSESVPPFVADLDSDSDSDRLESWMILGQEKEDGDHDIQLNVFTVHNQGQPEFVSVAGDEQGWAVSDKDKEAQICNKRGLVVARRASNRYYTEKTVTCRNCNKLGHLSKNCPTPKKAPCCSLCGLQGHFVKSCPNRYCSNCALPGHTYDDCLERAYWHKRCHRCNMTGHFADACPDIWRQYHLTTRAGPPEKSQNPDAQKSPAYCYNCAGRGHFGHECTERRMFNGTYPTLPFASAYDNQHDINRREYRAQLRAKELHLAGLLEHPGDAPTPQPPRKRARNTPFRSAPLPQTPQTHGPKRRIAHTPKHPPQATPKPKSTPNMHLQWNDGTPTRRRRRKKKNGTRMHTAEGHGVTPDAHGANTPRFEGKKKPKNRKQNPNPNQDDDFPRSCQKSPGNKRALIHTPPYGGRRSPGAAFGSEKSKKKMKKDEKRVRKAARDPENLFLIKQRKRTR